MQGRKVGNQACEGNKWQMATNILFPLTSFVGRTEALDQLWELLLLPQLRIITIVGAGGMGKTRLALELARLLNETPPELSSGNPHFPGGLWWVDLSALPVWSPAGCIIQEIAAVFALTVEADASLLDAVAALLADRTCLLLLDNCEHVVTACAEVVQQLALRCPHSKIIATSREALRVPGEQLFALTPLSVLQGRRNRQQPVSPPDQLDQLCQADAVQLFIERARLRTLDFALTDEQIWSIAQICQWVDGLPLAIELAAARVRLLPPAALLQQLGQGQSVTALLGQGPRTAPPRLLTIYNTIDWSYRLLESTTEQALFQQMAVFAGGARLEEIQAICEETWGPAAAHANLLATLEALLEKSLLTSQDHQGVRRYGMLLTIQEYALERLTEAGAADRLRARHLAVYTQLAEHGDAHLSGAQQLRWLDQLEAEQENFRAALIWALGEAGQPGHDPKGGMALLAALCDFWSVRGYWSEGQQWAERTLQWLHTDLAAYPPALQARVYLTAGLLNGNTAAPLPWLQRALALYRTEGNQKAVALALRWLLHIHLALRDWEATAAVAKELTPFAEAFNHPILLLALGRAAFVQGDAQGAQRYFQRGELAASQQGHLLAWVYAVCLQGLLANTTGEGVRLEESLQQALEQARRLGRKDLQMHLCHTLSEIVLGRHAYSAALALISEGLPLARQLGHQTVVAIFLYHCANIAARIEPTEWTASSLIITAHHLLQQQPHLAELMVEMAYQRAAAQARLVNDACATPVLANQVKPLALDEAITYAGLLQQRFQSRVDSLIL